MLLLLTALLAMSLSLISLYFSWRLYSFTVDGVLNHQLVEEKILSVQSISIIDKRLLISEIRNNGEYMQMGSDLLSYFGYILIGLSFVIVAIAYRVRKQLECLHSENRNVKLES